MWRYSAAWGNTERREERARKVWFQTRSIFLSFLLPFFALPFYWCILFNLFIFPFLFITPFFPLWHMLDITFLSIASVVCFYHVISNFSKFLHKTCKNVWRKDGRRKGNTGKKANRNILVKQEIMRDTKAYLLPIHPLRSADWLQQQRSDFYSRGGSI